MLTQTMLKSLLRYNCRTGHFTWKVERNSHGGKVKPGDRAGHLAPNGYVLIGIDGQVHRAHRLAWLYVTGQFPDGFLDHKNGDRADNRWANLREITNQANGENSTKAHKDSKSGLRGVESHRDGGFVARLMVRGKKHYLGYFPTPEEANAAYLRAKAQLHEAWIGK